MAHVQSTTGLLPNLRSRAFPELSRKFGSGAQRAWEIFESVAYARGEDTAFRILAASNDPTSFSRACSEAIRRPVAVVATLAEPPNGTVSSVNSARKPVALDGDGRMGKSLSNAEKFVSNAAAMASLRKKDDTAHSVITLFYGVGCERRTLAQIAQTLMEVEDFRTKVPSEAEVESLRVRGLALLQSIHSLSKTKRAPIEKEPTPDFPIQNFRDWIRLRLTKKPHIVPLKDALRLLEEITGIIGQERTLRILCSIRTMQQLQSAALRVRKEAAFTEDPALAAMSEEEFRNHIRKVLKTERKDLSEPEQVFQLIINITTAKTRALGMFYLRTIKSLSGLRIAESNYCSEQRKAARAEYLERLQMMPDDEFKMHIRDLVADKFAPEDLDEACRLITKIAELSDREKAADSLDNAESLRSLRSVFRHLDRGSREDDFSYLSEEAVPFGSGYSAVDEARRRLRVEATTPAVVAFLEDKQQYSTEDEQIAAKRLMLTALEVYEGRDAMQAAVIKAATHARNIEDLEFMLRTLATYRNIGDLVTEREPEKNYSGARAASARNAHQSFDEPLSEPILAGEEEVEVAGSHAESFSPPTEEDLADLERDEAEEQQTISSFVELAKRVDTSTNIPKPEEIAELLARLIDIRPTVFSELERDEDGVYEVLNLRFGLDGGGIKGRADVARELNRQFHPKPELTMVYIAMLERRGLRFLSRMLKD